MLAQIAIMISLLNGCRRTELKVYPANWSTKKASTRKNWYIWYRFHDPAYVTEFPKGKLVSQRGMNGLKDLAARQMVTTKMIAEEKRLLDEKGYNPISKQYMIIKVSKAAVITATTGLIKTLDFSS